MSYEKLLDDLETLQKSYAAGDEDDKKIQAAAEDGEKDGDEEELDEDGKPVAKKEVAEGDGDADDKPFAKSMMVTMENGEEFEAIDGTAMIKSLSDRVDCLVADAEEDKVEKGDLVKSLEVLVDVIKNQGAQLKEQSTLIKSLQESYTALASSGSGRRSVMSPSLDLVKSLKDSEPLNAGSFMMKANAAFDSGRISGKDLTICDVALRHGTEIDPAIVSKVMAG